MSEQQYREQVKRLAAVFDATVTTKAKGDEMVRSLSDMPIEHLEVVVSRIIDTRTSGFMPTPGEVREAYVELVLGPPAPSESLDWCLAKHRELVDAFDAAYFAKPVLQRGERVPYRPKPPTEFPDRVTEEAVRLCDWAELIGMDEGFRKGFWDRRYATAREHMAKRIQAGEVRLSLPQPENVRAIGRVA